MSAIKRIVKREESKRNKSKKQIIQKRKKDKQEEGERKQELPRGKSICSPKRIVAVMQPDAARRGAQPSLKTITIVHHKGSLRRSNLVPGIIKMSCSPEMSAVLSRSRRSPSTKNVSLRCRPCISFPVPSQSSCGNPRESLALVQLRCSRLHCLCT